MAAPVPNVVAGGEVCSGVVNAAPARRARAFAVLAGAAFIVWWLLLIRKARSQPCDGAALQVLQTPLAAWRADVLDEKRPIVIPDRVRDKADLLRTLFRYRFVRRREVAVRVRGSGDGADDGMAASASTFLLLFSEHPQPTHVDIAHPTRAGGVVRVVLRAHQTLVLPYGWLHAAPPGSAVRAWALDDWAQLLLLRGAPMRTTPAAAGAGGTE